MLIKTQIAPVLTKLPHYLPKEPEAIAAYAKAAQRMVPLKNPKPASKDGLFWLDEMLGNRFDGEESGLYLPEDESGRPFVLVVSGPPGTAKSTFALQLCYNFACSEDGKSGNVRPSSLYITTETSDQHIVDKARNFGWKHNEHFRIIQDFADLRNSENAASICHVMSIHNGPAHFSLGEINIFQTGQPKILVLDSLNTSQDLVRVTSVDNHPISQLMQYCYAATKGGPRLIILVLDVENTEEQLTKRFGFFADATIRFDMSTDERGLLHRTIQITKIKSQKHAEGKHTVAIYTRPAEHIWERESPFLEVGGVFVFPNIQWHLEHIREWHSTKGDEPAEPHKSSPAPLFPDSMGRIIAPNDKKLQGLFPGHTISCIGLHNNLKVRFAYSTLLHSITTNLEDGICGLIVSLDSDKDKITEILAGVLETEFVETLKSYDDDMVNKSKLIDTPQTKNQNHRTPINFLDSDCKRKLAVEFVNYLFESDKLGFIHNEPSYITPGEFFHRVYVAYKRPRKSSNQTIRFVVVDGLDQIETKFPLCAKEPLFISSLVTLLKIDKQACALFISSQDLGIDHAAYSASALVPLSDLLLRFIDPADLQKCQDSIAGVARQRRNDQFARECAEVHAIRVPTGMVSEPMGILWSARAGGRLHFNVPDPRDPGNFDDTGTSFDY